MGDRAYHLCEYCLVHEEDVYHDCEVDHVMSVKHGGFELFGYRSWASISGLPAQANLCQSPPNFLEVAD